MPTEITAASSTPAVVTVLGGTATTEVSAPIPPTSTWTSTWTSTVTGTFLSSTGVPLQVTDDTDTTGAATAVSAMSLSGGIGSLVSSGGIATSRSPGVTLSVSSDTNTTSTIHVIEDTLTPTAASSLLTTSGIPGSLTVNLSLVSSNPTLDSSVALVSFGSSSPAIYSTVLPPGASLGTSSQTLTMHSTVVLNSVSLTGVTLLAPRSPTSCYTLPTPAASMDMLAVAIVPVGDYDLSNPVIISFGQNGTVPHYVSAMASGNPYVLDLSPKSPIVGQLGLQIPGDAALVFDGSGMQLYTGNCSTLTEVLVDNFYKQLGSVAGAVSSRSTASDLHKRQSAAPSAFTVVVAVDSYLNTALFSPNLTFGNTRCTHQFDTEGSQSVNITWSCLYPPPMGDVDACAANLSTWFSDMNVPSPDPDNTTEVLATLGPFLSLAGDSILDLFPGSDPALGLGFAFMRQIESAAKQAVAGSGGSVCDVLHAFDSDDLVLADGGPLGIQTLGSYMTDPPPSVAINLAASATSIITGLPPRKANPTDDFLKQIATDFRSIFGAFTHWLGGLPLPIPLPLGTVGLEESATLPGMILTGVAATLVSTSTLAPPSAAHAQMPTVTVTHFMGDGWFKPSTYILRPGTSTIPQHPALATVELEAEFESRPTWISLDQYADLASSSSTPTYASSNVVDYVMAQLAAVDAPDAGVQPGHRWDLPNPQNPETRTTTEGRSLGYGEHVIVVTTTIYLSDASHHD